MNDPTGDVIMEDGFTIKQTPSRLKPAPTGLPDRSAVRHKRKRWEMMKSDDLGVGGTGTVCLELEKRRCLTTEFADAKRGDRVRTVRDRELFEFALIGIVESPNDDDDYYNNNSNRINSPSFLDRSSLKGSSTSRDWRRQRRCARMRRQGDKSRRKRLANLTESRREDGASRSGKRIRHWSNTGEEPDEGDADWVVGDCEDTGGEASEDYRYSEDYWDNTLFGFQE